MTVFLTVRDPLPLADVDSPSNGSVSRQGETRVVEGRDERPSILRDDDDDDDDDDSPSMVLRSADDLHDDDDGDDDDPPDESRRIFGGGGVAVLFSFLLVS